MELCVYIHKNTDQAVSDLLDVPVRTVSSWRRLERAPTTSMAFRIIEKPMVWLIGPESISLMPDTKPSKRLG